MEPIICPALPHLPGGFAARPEAVERLELAVGVHAHPEVLVAVDGELAVAREPPQRRLLEDQLGLVGQVVEDLALEDEEAAADEALGRRRLLVELGHHAVLHAHLAVARAGVDAGDGADAVVRAVEREQRLDVDAADAVAVGEHEGVGVDVLPDAVQPAAGARRQPGLGERHLPVLGHRVVVEGGRLVAADVDRQVRALLVVAEEELLDLPALVAEADEEAAGAVVPVELHDVPQDRPLADLDERLGHALGLLAQPGADPAREDDDGHPLDRGVAAAAHATTRQRRSGSSAPVSSSSWMRLIRWKREDRKSSIVRSWSA